MKTTKTALIAPGTYGEEEAASRIGIHRTTLRALVLSGQNVALKEACIWLSSSKRVYSRKRIDALVDAVNSREV